MQLQYEYFSEFGVKIYDVHSLKKSNPDLLLPLLAAYKIAR